MFDPRLRVLIAEDETIIRLDLRQILEENGLDVCAEARDGLEAIELARDSKPDVAVLDVKMPNLDGIEAARRIYAERPIPIVMLTAYSEAALVTRAVGAGVFGYLIKPFRRNDVAPAILAAVARHQELLEARREVGRAQGPLDVDVRTSGGTPVPLRFKRRPDGSLDVSVQREKP